MTVERKKKISNVHVIFFFFIGVESTRKIHIPPFLCWHISCVSVQRK